MTMAGDESPTDGYNAATYGGKDQTHGMAIIHNKHHCLPSSHSNSWLHDEQ